MAALATDIVTVLTGGSSNVNPNLSIGGIPSNQPIFGSLNSLFDNAAQIEADNGMTDYRCIYVFNNNSNDSFYDVKTYSISIANTTSEIQLGITKINEIQKITIQGSVDGGSFNISYKPPTQDETETKTVAFSGDPSTWATNLQNELNSIPTFENIIVDVSGTFISRIFNINFNDFRSHDLLGLSISNLTVGGIPQSEWSDDGNPNVVVGSVSKTITGSPINSIPVLLDSQTTTPNGVTFFNSSTEAVEIGTLYPEEGFPLWIKRTVAAGTSPIAGDGFTLRIIASPILSS